MESNKPLDPDEILSLPESQTPDKLERLHLRSDETSLNRGAALGGDIGARILLSPFGRLRTRAAPTFSWSWPAASSRNSSRSWYASSQVVLSIDQAICELINRCLSLGAQFSRQIVQGPPVELRTTSALTTAL